MKYRALTFIIIICLICTKLFAQNYIPFTDDVRKIIESHGLSIEKLQFYNASEIELKRVSSSSDVTIEHGKLKYEDNQHDDIIDYPPYTMGVCIEDAKGFILISFQQGFNYILRFGKWSGKINGINSDNYVLGPFAKSSEITDPNAPSTLDSHDNLIEIYNGKRYQVTKGAFTKLVMKQIGVETWDVEIQKPKGYEVH